MARNRMIRPEIWSNEQFVELSTTARLLYIAMWNFADDGGNHPASPKTLKMEIFPGDDITAAEIEKLISEIIAQNLITPYTAAEKPYWHINNWQNLQKIDRPNPTHPAPFVEQSTNDRQQVGENPQIKERREIIEKREERESARAHEEKQENQKTDDTTPHDPYTHCLAQIRQWGRADGNWQPLLEYARSVNYDPDTYGPVNDEVQKFTAYWLDPKRHNDDRRAFQADPAQFFQDRGRKWLLDAKNLNKPKRSKSEKPHYTPPPLHQRQPRTNGNATGLTTIGDITGRIITEIS